MQLAPSGRKLFCAARRKAFLEHLAATCNVARAAAAAGVTDRCVYGRRMRDPLFHAEWQAALEQGYARLEAMLVERATGRQRIDVAGGLEVVVDEAPFDRDLALHLLREHKRGLAGVRQGGGAPPASAEWSEVEVYFGARLKALRGRIVPAPKGSCAYSDSEALPGPNAREEDGR